MYLVPHRESRQIIVESISKDILDFLLCDRGPGVGLQDLGAEGDESIDQRWQHPAAVWDQECDVGIRSHGPGHDEVHHCACGVEEELYDRRWIVQGSEWLRRAIETLAARCGMEEDLRLPSTELLEYRIERLVAEIDAMVVGEQSEAIGLQFIQRKSNLVETGLDIWQWEAGKRSESPGVSSGEVRGVLVDSPGEAFGFGQISKMHSGRADTKVGFADPGILHEFEVFALIPGWYCGHAIWFRDTSLHQCIAIEIWKEVRMGINPSGCCHD